MSFEPRDYLRHILVEADYTDPRVAGPDRLHTEGGLANRRRADVNERHVTRGDVGWRGNTTHTIENAGTTDIHALIIEPNPR